MRKYNHYSFDLWLTLIKSNPFFKQKRNELFHQLLTDEKVKTYELSEYDVDNIVREVDVLSNKKSEVTGVHVDSLHMIYDILKRVVVIDDIPLEFIESFDMKIQELFLQYPPTLYDENTKDVLKRLHEDGCVLNILSNTGFIKGETLGEVLYMLGIRDYFEFTIYSDEVGISKPNVYIFQMVKSASVVNVYDILHVGDNPIADGGSSKVGIPYFQINSNNKTIEDLLW